MNLNLFACNRGGYLVTPECMLASIEAHALHGPADRFLGVVDGALFPEAVRRHVEAQIDLFAFAFFDQHAGDHVLAIRRTVRASRTG